MRVFVGRSHLLALSACLLACSGSIDGSQDGPGGAGSGGAAGAAGAAGQGGGFGGMSGASGQGGAAGNTPGSCVPELRAPRAVLAPLRQYQNILRDLFGPDAVRDEDESVDIEFEVIDRPRMSTSSLDQIVRLAEGATESIRGQTATVLGCSALSDRACVQTGIAAVARRAFKRAPADDEIDALMEVYDDVIALGPGAGTDLDEDAALAALMAVVTSPSTLYRTEFEGLTGTPARVTLTANETAAAIAALLLDSVPDAELIAAADSGALADPAGVAAEITRLFALPRVQAHLSRVMLSGFKVPKLFQSPKDGALFPEYGDLQLSMYDETRLFLDDVLFTRGAPLTELLVSRKSFVDSKLAELYGVAYPGTPGGDEMLEVELPASRSGILTQPSVLSVLSRTEKTSVVARGLFVRGAIMCLPKVPGPPASVQAEVDRQLAADSTQAELAEFRATTSPCMNCHSQFDRFGLLLEAFDAIGREQTGTAMPIDLTGLANFMGVVDGPAQLAQALTADSQFVDCLAERVLSYALSEATETGTSCVPDSIATALHAPDANMQTLINTVVAHPAFSERELTP